MPPKGGVDYGESTKTSWKTVIFFTVLAIGVSYFMFPEMYHGIYNGLKDKFFPDNRGGGGNSSNNDYKYRYLPSLKGK